MNNSNCTSIYTACLWKCLRIRFCQNSEIYSKGPRDRKRFDRRQPNTLPEFAMILWTITIDNNILMVAVSIFWLKGHGWRNVLDLHHITQDNNLWIIVIRIIITYLKTNPYFKLVPGIFLIILIVIKYLSENELAKSFENVSPRIIIKVQNMFRYYEIIYSFSYWIN